MAFVMVDLTGRLISYADPGFHCGAGEIEATIPDDFDPERLRDYILQDGVVVHDPLPVEPEESEPTSDDRLAYVEEALEMILSGVTE